MKKIVGLGLLLIFGLASSPIFGQTTECTENLEEATLYYNDGNVDRVEPLLKNCLNNNSFTRQQRAQALRLLILTYLLLEEDDQADSTMLVLIQKNHEYQPDYNLDPVELINLHRTYRTKPIFSVGVKAGSVYAFPEVSRFYTTGEIRNLEYSPKFSFTGGFQFEYAFSDRWILYPELIYSTKTITRETEFNQTSGIAGAITKSEIFINTQWLEIPISVQYNFNTGKIWPYLFAGGSAAYLLTATLPSSLNRLDRGEGIPEVQITDRDVKSDYNSWAGYVMGGLGVKVKAYEGYVFLEGRFNYQINQLSENQVPNEQEIMWSLMALHDHFRLHFATLSLGYTLNIYKPKKL